MQHPGGSKPSNRNRWHAPVDPSAEQTPQLIKQQLMIAQHSRPGKFKYNGIATLGLELPGGPVSGYKASRKGSKDTTHRSSSHTRLADRRT